MARLVHFFAVRGQKNRGYICDSVLMTMRGEYSMLDFFRGRSNDFENTLSKVEQISIECYIFVREKMFRVADFEALKEGDEVYVCESKYKSKLENYYLLSTKSTVPSSSGITTESTPNPAGDSGSRKRKREASLLEKLQSHEKRKMDDPEYRKGNTRQQFIERETIDAYRRSKALSMIAFDEKYNDLAWKKCKCISIMFILITFILYLHPYLFTFSVYIFHIYINDYLYSNSKYSIVYFAD